MEEDVRIKSNIFTQKTELCIKEEYGYNVHMLESFPEKYKCPLCKKLMRQPVQTTRGELACEMCYKNAQRDTSICPIDGQRILTSQVFTDKARNLEILNLHCFCVNKRYGCDWNDIVAKLQVHQTRCLFQAVECVFCHEESTVNDMNDHYYKCSRIQNKESTCVYQKCGCSHKPQTAIERVAHVKNDSFIHTELLISRFRTENNELREHLEKMKSKHETALLQIQLLTEKYASIKSEVQKLGNPQEYAGQCNETDAANYEELKKLPTEVSLLSKNMCDLDLRQQISEQATYDGRILWKIDNLDTRYNQAITGRVTALHSAPGFTSKYGYKFCGRLYLSGDGMGKCTHTSLFFVLMKSEYDILLSWPFHRHVTFKLINQEDHSRSVTESFISDKSSSSFKRPTKEMNVAAGCPLFIPKEEMLNGGFVKENALFIEIIVSEVPPRYSDF